MWRLGILSGTGTARKRTIPALLGSRKCRVSLVHGRDSRRLEEVAQLDGSIKLVTSDRHFCDSHESFDVVYIASPPFLHIAHLRLAASLGKPIICEKPLVTQRDDLDAAMSIIEGCGVPFMLAHHVRHQAAVADLANMIGSPMMGLPLGASLQWCFQMDHAARNGAWKLHPALGGSNAMFDSGVHAVDLALLLFGFPLSVRAVGSKLRSASTFDAVRAQLSYGDFSVSILASQSMNPSRNNLTVEFESGRIVRADGLLGERSVRSIVNANPNESVSKFYQVTNLYTAEVENFCDGIERSVAVGTTGRDAAAACTIMFAIEDAIATGKPVTL